MHAAKQGWHRLAHDQTTSSLEPLPFWPVAAAHYADPACSSLSLFFSGAATQATVRDGRYKSIVSGRGEGIDSTMGRVPKNTLREGKKGSRLPRLARPLPPLDGLRWLDKHVTALRKRPETQRILGHVSALALPMLDWLQQTISKKTSQGWTQAIEASAARVLCCVCMCLRGRGWTSGVGRRLVSCHSARSARCGKGREGKRGGGLFYLFFCPSLFHHLVLLVCSSLC